MKFFIKKLLLFFSFFTLVTSLANCSIFNGTRFEDSLGANVNLIKFSYGIADNLINNALPPLISQHPDMPILVTTYVDNNNLDSPSRFGRILQEHIISRFVQLGYTVREIKLAHTLSMRPGKGETILSRNLSLLGDKQQAQAIFVGTISTVNRTMYISSRLIAPASSNIIATYDEKLIMDDDVLAMFGLKRSGLTSDPIKNPGRPLLNTIL